MRKKSFAAILLLMLCISLVMVGCRQKTDNETTESTAATTLPEESTGAEETTEQTLPEEYSIPAGIMKSHPNGANGNTGIYFTMEPNEVPADSTWATEFRPASMSVVQLIRDGQTYDVGNYMTGMVIKYSDTEYYLKTEPWVNKKYFPLQSGDIIKVEGAFKNSELEVSFTIDTTYILFEEGLVFFSTEYPDGSVGAKVITVSPFTDHSKGMVSTGFYVTAPKNAAPATDWSVEYKPVSADAVKLIRGGKTYSIGNTAAGTLIKFGDTEYFLKMEQWIIKDYYPLRDGDIVIVEGKFANSSTGILMNVKKTYIAVNQGMIACSTEYPTQLPTANVVDAGAMSKHIKGYNGNGIYFTMEENNAPYDSDWSVRFNPAEGTNVKLIRDGKTYNVGNPDAETIVKFSETEYFLELWPLKSYRPIEDGDILVIEGTFTNSATRTVLNISKSYIAYNEGLVAMSTEYPTELPTANVVDAGAMSSHIKGYNGNGIYFTMAANDAPFNTDWSVRYNPSDAVNVKLIRGGTTYDVGNAAAETIVKFSETEYFLELWPLKSHLPITDGDILVIEGDFLNAGTGTTVHISKSYIAYNEGLVAFSTEYPTELPTSNVIDAGAMGAHANGWDKTGGIYFTMTENEVPFNSDWSVRYNPTDAANIKLIRGGTTYSVGNTAAETIVKYSETEYHLQFWPMKSYLPIVDGDVLVVEGNFVNSGNSTTFSIDKTYITVENGQLTFSSDAPEIIEVGTLSSHSNGWNSNSGDGLYFSLPANEIPYDGWSVEYMPTSAANLKLERDGQTYNIGIPSRGTIVKFDETGYYLKLAKWTIGDYFPIVPGDVLTVEGKYTNQDNGVTFNVSKTSITVGEDYSLTFNQEESVSDVIQAGTMSAYTESWNYGKTGFYFALAENAIPADSTGVLEYTPVTAASIKLIRDGAMVDIAIAERGTLVKYEEDKYFLKLDRWTIGDYYPIAPGDVLVVEGEFTNALNGVTFHISASSITVGEDHALTFTEGATEPGVIEAGTMSSHSNGWKGKTGTSNWGGLYFTMAKNAAPYNQDWSVRYVPASTETVKLIRDGVTYNVGNTGAEAIVKYSDTEYYFEGWSIGEANRPLVAGDVLIFEGSFVNSSENTTLNISKTTVTLNADGTATFESESTEEPEDGTLRLGTMSSHTNGINKDAATGYGKGIYFTMAENDAPQTGWAAYYKPVSADAVKLIRNGETYSIANTTYGTVLKYSATEYLLRYESSSIPDYYPITDGDILEVGGQFTYTDGSGVTTVISISTTYIIYADGTATFVTELPEESTAPSLTAHPNGWTTDTVYGTLEANDAPYDIDWALRYNPENADVIKVVRDGQTYSVGNPDAETLVKYSETEYCIVTWMFGDKKPQAGDVLIVEGVFTNKTSGASIEIGRTEITLNADGTATFVGQETEGSEEEEDPNVIKAGLMAAHTSGVNSSNLFFTMEENAVPYHLTKAAYKPESAAVIKLVRDGVTYEIGDPSQDTVQKTTKKNYKIKLSTLGDMMPLQDGDLLIIEGKFTGGNTNTGETATFSITKTYVSIVDGKAEFSATDPRS